MSEIYDMELFHLCRKLYKITRWKHTDFSLEKWPNSISVSRKLTQTLDPDNNESHTSKVYPLYETDYVLAKLLYKGIRVKVVGTYGATYDSPHWRAQIDNKFNEISEQGDTPRKAVLRLAYHLAEKGLL